MTPRNLLVILSLIFFHAGRAQYADLGSGALKNQIWWLDWAGFTIAEGASRTFQTNNGLTVKVTFSNVTSNQLQPSVMNTWSGAVLHLLYDFSDPNIKPALFDTQTNLGSHFKMTVTVSRGASPIGFSLVTADAEASSTQELTTLQTNGGSWETVDFFRNSGQTSDPLTGCGTQNVIISDTYGNAPQTGQNPVITTRSPGSGAVVLDVTLDHTVTTGGMGLAFGILEAVDRGDLPASYGTAQHELLYATANSCNYLAPLPVTSQVTNLKIGAVPGDPDPVQTLDDDAVGVDEEGVSSFATYNNNGSYSVSMPVGNTTGSVAYLTGWFDYNRNGQFDPGESVSVVVPDNTSSATLTWTGLPTYLPAGSASGYGFRFRICSNLQESQAATGNARDGEVEDYFVPSTTLCSITVSAKPDTTVCSGSPFPLTASGATQYSWTGAGLSDPTIANPIATPLNPVTYTVTGSNPQGCQASASVQVNILPQPVIIRSDDTTVCAGTSLTLAASGGIGNTWTSSDGLLQTTGATITVAPTQPTKYYVEVTNSNGCSKTDSISVLTHTPLPFSLSPARPSVCINDSILLTASGGDQYAWSTDDGPLPGDGPLLLAFLETSQHVNVQITDTMCQLKQTLQVFVVVRPQPATLVTKSNDIDCTLGQATLHATGGRKYVWDAVPGISDLTSSDPVVSPLTPTEYRVTITGPNGCSARDSILVGTDYTAQLNHFPVPSAFTPNGDGHNDCFGLKYWGSVTAFEMEVFNRWGQKVFVATGPNDCWDGNYKGKPQPAGAYIYQIKAATPCGAAYRKGTVFLIR